MCEPRDLVIAPRENVRALRLRGLSGIAISTEMMALLPRENKAMAAALLMALQSAGGALAGGLTAWTLDLGVFRDGWLLLKMVWFAYRKLKAV